MTVPGFAKPRDYIFLSQAVKWNGGNAGTPDSKKLNQIKTFKKIFGESSISPSFVTGIKY